MAVNPHAETYQGKTQFSGPVKAGTRWNGANAAYVDLPVGANPIAVNKLSNAGYVVCSQSAAVDQTTSRTITNIMLPPGSMILSVEFIVTTPYTTSTAAWTASQTWAVDDIRTGTGASVNNRYICTTLGPGATSGVGPAGGPDTTGIVDGTARWSYLNLAKSLTIFVDPGGTSVGGTYLCPKPNQGGTPVDAVGVRNPGPSLYSDEEKAWRNISDPTWVAGAQAGISVDVRKYSSEDGDGRAIVTVNYIPEFNYPLT